MAAKKKKSAKAPKKQSYDSAIGELVAQFTTAQKGRGEALLGGSPLLDSVVDIWMPTGCPCLDAMMGGGFPGGRVVQLFGNWSTGKSTIALAALLGVIEAGGIAILIDPEVSFDPDRFVRMGGDPNKLIILQKPQEDPGGKKTIAAKQMQLPAMTVQDIFGYLYDILGSIAVKAHWQGKPIMCVLDSLDNITTDEALLGKGEGMANKPRLIKDGFRLLTTPIAKTKASFVIVSQIIEKIGGRGGYDTSGGGGPKFISSLRLNTRKGYPASTYPGKDKEESKGILVTTTLAKSKLSKPFATCTTAINNDSSWAFEGIDAAYSSLFGCEEHITARGSYKYITPTGPLALSCGVKPGVEIGFQVGSWRDTLQKNPGLDNYMAGLLKEKYAKAPVFEPESLPEEETDEVPPEEPGE